MSDDFDKNDDDMSWLDDGDDQDDFPSDDDLNFDDSDDGSSEPLGLTGMLSWQQDDDDDLDSDDSSSSGLTGLFGSDEGDGQFFRIGRTRTIR